MHEYKMYLNLYLYFYFRECHHFPWGKHNCNLEENLVIKCSTRIPFPGDAYLNDTFDAAAIEEIKEKIKKITKLCVLNYQAQFDQALSYKVNVAYGKSWHRSHLHPRRNNENRRIPPYTHLWYWKPTLTHFFSQEFEISYF